MRKEKEGKARKFMTNSNIKMAASHAGIRYLFLKKEKQIVSSITAF